MGLVVEPMRRVAEQWGLTAGPVRQDHPTTPDRALTPTPHTAKPLFPPIPAFPQGLPLIMCAMASCRECGLPLLGDVEPERGVCSLCSPTELSEATRQPALRRTKGTLLVKRKTYICQQCGTVGIQTRRGRPRTFCPSCSTSTARRHRASA
jgi:hypothetical protein